MRRVFPVGSAASRRDFDRRLGGYSSVAKVAVVTAAAAGSASSVLAQGIVTFTGTPSLSLEGANAANHFTVTLGPAQIQFVGLHYRNTLGYVRGRLTVQGLLIPEASRHGAVVGGDGTLRNIAFNTSHNQINAAGLGGLSPFIGAGFAFRTHSTHGAYGQNAFGNFVPAISNGTKTGYVGFKRATGGNVYYGWIHVVVTAAGGRPTSIALTPGPHTGSVTGAYINAADGTITAGQITAIPESASVATGLALFALGAAGVREHRRRKRLAA